MATARTIETRRIGGRDFRLSMLTLGGLKRVGPALKHLRDVKPGEIPEGVQIDAMIAVVHASAKEHEPTLTIEEFTEHVEGLDYITAMAELTAAFEVVALESGLERTTAGDSPGGVRPESSTSPTSTG